jgi:mRNA interferase RelE/StbE
VSFRVVVTRTAARQLAEHLPEAEAAACVEFMFGPLAGNPHRVGAPLRTPFAGQWRARRGEYRVRYRIDDPKGTVYVLDIDHRRDAYRSRGLAERARGRAVESRGPGP